MGLVPEGRPRWPRRGDPSNKVLPSDAPDRRYHERRMADRRSRIIDRAWLGFLTALWIWAAFANQSRAGDIQSNRVVQTRNTCVKTNDVINGFNASQDLLANLVVSSVASPGDVPLPRGEKDPLKWTAIKDGPLSRSVEEKIPGYPSATERLKRAQNQARQIKAKEIAPRDCAADVAHVKKAN